MGIHHISFLAVAFSLPAIALAQDAPTPLPSPTATATAPITSPAIPSDFQLPPGGDQPTPAPVPSATTTAEPVIQPLPVDPAPQQSVQPAPVTTGQAPRRDATPPPSSEPSEAVEPQFAPSETLQEVPTDPPVATDVGNQGEAGMPLWRLGLGLLLIVALAVWLVLRRRGFAEAEPAFAPRLSQSAATNAAPPQPESLRKPQGAKREPAPPVRQFDPASLVSISPRSAQPVQRPATDSSGLVTTNLGAKRRAEAEALERARRDAEQRQAAARPAIKRSISFDWS